VNAVKIAAIKTSLPFTDALFRGILCNMLVCLAVWLAMGGRSVTDKVLAIVLPISAFVAAGFEHSVANMYFISLGILLKDVVPAAALANVDTSHLNLLGFAQNLLPVTIGNIVGGAVLVAACYMLVYRREEIRSHLERRQT
jgi:formate transporter